ncbi:RNA-binding protein [Apiospora sp. TS-2023a]
MATAAMDYETADGDRFEDDGPRYERDQRSASPRASRDDGHDTRRRSASPNGNNDTNMKDDGGHKNDEDGAINPGSNLFVTGIHPRLTEGEVTRLFEKYGEVEKCQIMKDPHTKESRGFGFVKMVTSDQADAAKDGLQGEVIDGRTLSIEKARRARPRTPTPGKYFGPPKRESEGGRRFDDRGRRGGGGYGGGGGGYGGGYGGRDDPYRYRGGGGGGGGYDRREDRGYDRGYDRNYRDDRGYDRTYREERGGYREERGGGGGGGGGAGGYERRDRDDTYTGSAGRTDRYASGGREDRDGGRYGGRGGGGGGGDRDRGYERPEREARSRDAAPSGYAESGSRPERDAYGGGAA